MDLITAAGTDDGKMRTIFSSHLKQDWESFSRFLARIRQARRKMKVVMAEMGVRRVEQSFEKQKEAWQHSGRLVCRYGVFFQSLSRINCPCMAPPSSADWNSAVLLPVLDVRLKMIGVDTFSAYEFQRLGVLRAECRRRNW